MTRFAKESVLPRLNPKNWKVNLNALGSFPGNLSEAFEFIGETAEDISASAAEELAKPLEIPQGFSTRSWAKFKKAARQTAREAGLPEGELVAHGSRVKGTAKVSAEYVSDIDVALRVDDETFFNFAQNRISSVHAGTELQKTLLRAARKGKLSAFDIGPQFNEILYRRLAPHSPFDIDFSMIRKGSKLDTGPFIRLGDF
jgi:predicted nucleotidyltransferase